MQAQEQEAILRTDEALRSVVLGFITLRGLTSDSRLCAECNFRRAEFLHR
jgi:hypothetical protein